VILLIKAGVVSVAKFKEARPYVIVGAFVIAAIITPPDVISQLMLAVPMVILYEVGILLGGLVSVRRPSDSGDAEPEPMVVDGDRDPRA
jgi:sec-independent protein translocase protein TatC